MMLCSDNRVSVKPEGHDPHHGCVGTFIDPRRVGAMGCSLPTFTLTTCIISPCPGAAVDPPTHVVVLYLAASEGPQVIRINEVGAARFMAHGLF